MKIDTKFGLGDTVYPIAQCVDKEWMLCSFCGGFDEETPDGQSCVFGKDGSSAACPRCHGSGGSYRFFGRSWTAFGESAVVEVIAKFSQDYTAERVESYLCQKDEGGSVHSYVVINVFSSEEEALAECSIRNNDGGVE